MGERMSGGMERGREKEENQREKFPFGIDAGLGDLWGVGIKIHNLVGEKNPTK